MKRFTYLFCCMIVLAAMTSCNQDEPQKPAESQSYTMTILATKGAEAESDADGSVKRALSLTGHTLNATWNEGEIVEVHQSGSKIGELTAAASDNTSTTLTGSFASAPSSVAPLTFYFHAATIPSYSGQDGTLETIASTYDFCAPATVLEGYFSVDNENKTISVPGGITFGANHQAIVKFTLKKKSDGTDLPVTSLTVNGYSVTPTSATNVLFVAIPATNTVTLTTALDGYRKTNDNLIEAGKYYEITVKMSPRLAVKHTGGEDYTVITANTTLVDGDIVTGTLFEDLEISIESGATVTLSGVNINGGNTLNHNCAGLTCNGNTVITLAENTTNFIHALADNFPGIQVGSSLTINGSGSLTVVGGANAAGIGSAPSLGCGNILIEGGTIDATGGTNAAAIGCSLSGMCGNITLSGGTVTATCGSGAATVIKSYNGDITINGTHSVTLNNPNNSGSSVSSRTFMDTGKTIHLAQMEWSSDSHWGIQVGEAYLLQDNTLNVKFGCLTAQQFVYRPVN